MERWFSAKEHSLLLQRTQLWFPALTWQLTAILNLVPGDLALSGPQEHQAYTCHTYIDADKALITENKYNHFLGS